MEQRERFHHVCEGRYRLDALSGCVEALCQFGIGNVDQRNEQVLFTRIVVINPGDADVGAGGDESHRCAVIAEFLEYVDR
ncbi:Uncharacterised protein [Mycobacteroides abscessus subsp. abscessus]|nr:Uncharacterised protein [Mycobacteroides abscessus subsp. abscessus]